MLFDWDIQIVVRQQFFWERKAKFLHQSLNVQQRKGQNDPLPKVFSA